MTKEEAALVLENLAIFIKDSFRFMRPEHIEQFKEAYNLAIKALKEPPADVQEVKHGKWGIVEYEYFTCSACGESYFNDMDSHKMAEDYLKNNGAYKYCPWCGAKMDGKDGEDAEHN